LSIKSREGFTLVELLVVIVILGILATSALAFFSDRAELARQNTDLANLRILNGATEQYRFSNTNTLFSVPGATDEVRMQALVDGGHILDAPQTLVKNTQFAWSFDDHLWIIIEGDPIVIGFTDALAGSAITYTDFLTKSSNWSVNGSNYTPNNWNGYLEKLLETGDVASNSRPPDPAPGSQGSNTIGYQNPYGNNNQLVANVDNWNNWWKSNYPNPAIIITRDSRFAHASSDPFVQNNVDNLRGSMIFYKDNSAPNSETQVYYVREDGSRSALVPLEEVLP